MPKFVSIETGNICGASRPANTPRQACSLDCIAKLRFAFHPALPARQLRQTFCSIQHVLFRRHPANTFQARFLTEYYTFRPPLPTYRRQPANNLSPHIFLYWRPHNLPPTNNFHSGLTGQYVLSLILSLSFFSSIPFYTKKETDFAGFNLFFLQSQI